MLTDNAEYRVSITNLQKTKQNKTKHHKASDNHNRNKELM